jgi:tetratricopeptide (TPR) repeat protein
MKSVVNVFKGGLLFFLVLAVISCGGKDERKLKYLDKGKAFLLEKNYDKARIEFKNVIQIDPKFAEAYFYMGQVEEKNKELGKALGQYRKAIELDENYTKAKIKLAKIYVVAGTAEFIADAKKLLQEVKLKGPSNAEAELISATIEYKTGDKVKALADLESVVKENINLVEGIGLLSSIYMAESKYLKAEKLLTKGVKNNKKNISLRISLAKLQAKNKKYDLAEKYLQEAISIEPDEFSLRVALGMFYAASNQLSKSEQVFRQAIKEDDEDVQRYLILVELLFSRVGVEKAMDELKSAIQQKPELYKLQFAMAEFYKKVGKISEAKNVLIKIMAEKSYDPEGIKARNLLSVIFLDEGDAVSAHEYVSQILEEHPNNIAALLTNAKLSLKNLDAVSAINGLRTVVRSEPKNVEASLLLAQAHEMNKESSLAENELQKSIEASPEKYKVHANYANFLVQKKRHSDALDVVEKALLYFKDNYELLDLKLILVAADNDEVKVVSILNTMKRIAPQKYEVYLKQGQYYLAKRQFDMAIIEFEQALERTNKKYFILDKIIKVYYAQKQPDKAINRLNKRLNEHKNDMASQQLLGQIYLTKKDFIKAREYFNQAIANDKSWEIPYTFLAGSYLMEKNTPAAMKIYRQAATVVANKASMLIRIAGLYEKDDKYKQAIKIYDEILNINPNNMLATNNLAALLLDHGSENDISRVLELTKDFDKINQPALQDTLAWAYAKSGNNQKAIEIFSSIIKQAPKVAVFQYHLGATLFDNGEKDKARPYLQMSVDSKQAFFGKEEAKKLLATY